jgi:putative membrane protein
VVERARGLTPKQMAGWVIVGNQAEVQLGQLAEGKAQTEQVRKFAREMVQEHSKLIQKLQQAVPGTQAGIQRQGAGQPTHAAGGDSLTAIKRQIGARVMAMTKQALQNKQGAEFDKAYMNQQLVAHTKMLATLQVLEQHAGGKLQPLLQQGVTTTAHHLQQVKQILSALEGPRAATAAQPGAAPQRQ